METQAGHQTLAGIVLGQNQPSFSPTFWVFAHFCEIFNSKLILYLPNSIAPCVLVCFYKPKDGKLTQQRLEVASGISSCLFLNLFLLLNLKHGYIFQGKTFCLVQKYKPMDQTKEPLSNLVFIKKKTCAVLFKPFMLKAIFYSKIYKNNTVLVWCFSGPGDLQGACSLLGTREVKLERKNKNFFFY